MCAVPLREQHEPCPVEVDTSEVCMIGVLPGTQSHRAEPHLPLYFIETVYATDDPIALRDLALQPSVCGIEQVQVVPAVSLRHPDELVRLVELTQEELLAVVDERGATLLHNRSGLATPGVDRYDPQDLMTALVVQEREP